jgi:hypothetical protein
MVPNRNINRVPEQVLQFGQQLEVVMQGLWTRGLSTVEHLQTFRKGQFPPKLQQRQTKRNISDT